ncbi:Druantia anti-phage system protein DruA [Curtobacterium sp. BRD11]|uniref:Druantia anti-phage system protein DruA n=1 Tax=Curtobacterium sp. BRD11 TaxID=2962581 RepID=UPI0028825E3D|nr:Druantia anti-phage system protein DruA [Curtobacterium sp. BRD11]MDT0212053.1 DUF4338 domain-containing protein [Curtobacterium sp. BRD11]
MVLSAADGVRALPTDGESSAVGAVLSVDGLPAVGPDGVPLSESALRLRKDLIVHLRRQGFQFRDGGLEAPPVEDKEHLRALHGESVRSQLDRARPALERHEGSFLERLADGDEVDPSRIRPRLIELHSPRDHNGLLWRWSTLHWSIPVSAGYGRRVRFLVVDEGHNDRLMGLIGLADPVFAMRARDAAIGWSGQQQRAGLINMMDAFVLGAVPPYRELLAGKLMALLATSNEVREVFARKYSGSRGRISGEERSAQLAAVTTSSALGRSSVYSRLRRRDGSWALAPVGFSSGSGDFHFTGPIYDDLVALASEGLGDGLTQRKAGWGGTSFRNRREVVQRALHAMGLDGRRLRFHGVQRELFLGLTASNSLEFLRGEEDALEWRDDPVGALSEWWRERWAVPRSERRTDWQTFRREAWRLYR